VGESAEAWRTDAYGQWRTAREALERMADNDPAMSGLRIKSRYGDAVQNPLVSIARKAAQDMPVFVLVQSVLP